METDFLVNGVTTNYHLVGHKVTYEDNGTNKIYYTYDSTGKLASMNISTYNASTKQWSAGVEYYYIRNAQSDIIGLIDKTGIQVVTYTYDSWGKLISTTGTLASTVSVKNPYRYRGYRYDTETGLYYLQSRYYNAEWGRFINADGIVGQTGELLGHNMFAYCKNNVVNGRDPSGFRVVFESEEEQREYDQWIATQRAKQRSNNSSSSSVPSGGKSVYKGSARVCTDGSSGPKGNGKQIPDDNWQPETAYPHKGKPIDAYIVPYVVLPAYPKNNIGYKLGDSALLINHDTGKSVMCVIGEVGSEKNGWGEVSIAAIWDTGNPGHNSANNDPPGNYEIIVY